LNTNISITVTNRRSTWQDTPLLLCYRGCQVAYLIHVMFLFSPIVLQAPAPARLPRS
jgi:hypothetical protein